jgi:hypothetical protein
LVVAAVLLMKVALSLFLPLKKAERGSRKVVIPGVEADRRIPENNHVRDRDCLQSASEEFSAGSGTTFCFPAESKTTVIFHREGTVSI